MYQVPTLNVFDEKVKIVIYIFLVPANCAKSSPIRCNYFNEIK